LRKETAKISYFISVGALTGTSTWTFSTPLAGLGKTMGTDPTVDVELEVEVGIGVLVKVAVGE